MARYDYYIRLERQRIIYQPENICVIDKGHVTGAGQTAIHRSHILAGLA